MFDTPVLEHIKAVHFISNLNFPQPEKNKCYVLNLFSCSYSQYSNVLMRHQLAASPLFLERPTCVLDATRRCILVSSSTCLGTEVRQRMWAPESGCHGFSQIVCVCYNSGEGDIIGQRLASTLPALWEVQQDSGSWQPCRGEAHITGKHKRKMPNLIHKI